MSNLREKYYKEVVPYLQKELNRKTILACPKVSKIVVNVGTGKRTIKDASKRDQILKSISEDLSLITGQRPQITKAKKSISGFSVREGMPVGLRVTLRGKRMYDFLDRLINIVLPRVRDFRGINISSIDKEGNITLGLVEHTVFPEIAPENISQFFGMEITIATTSKNKEEGEKLLKQLGFPFKK